MKNSYTFLIVGLFCTLTGVANGAVNVKKSAPVNTQTVEKIDSVQSLLPGAINLVTSVSALKTQQRALKEECVPTESEITWVNNMVKEWAKVGEVSADEMLRKVGDVACDSNTSYKDYLNNYVDGNDICVEVFTDDNNVWAGFPKASKGEYCSDGTPNNNCSKKYKKTISNIYDVFYAIGFSEQDYVSDEATMYKKLSEKVDKCSDAKMRAKQREAYAGFVKTTLSGIGQKTNTGSILETVSGLAGNSSGVGGILQNLAPVATSLMDK